MVLWLVLGYCCLYLLYVIKLAEVAVGLCKLCTNKPYIINISRSDEINNFLMFLFANLAKFAHIAKYRHLVISLHDVEVLQCCHHA